MSKFFTLPQKRFTQYVKKIYTCIRTILFIYLFIFYLHIWHNYCDYFLLIFSDPNIL
jgi:hypothetical protein